MSRNNPLLIVTLFFYLSFAAPAYAASLETIQSIQKESQALATRTQQEIQQASTRWSHAKELLGKAYKKSIVKIGEKVTTLDDILFEWTKKELKGHWKSGSARVTRAILEESDRYGFDPVFLMAVIENESGFNPEIVGSVGEIGLMQITPQTAEWVTNKYDISWNGKNSLKDPVINIRIGAAYMAYLREKFDFQSQLYLAAYNMGCANVHRALGRQIRPKEYSIKVMNHYVHLYSKLNDEIQKKFD